MTEKSLINTHTHIDTNLQAQYRGIPYPPFILTFQTQNQFHIFRAECRWPPLLTA